MKILMFPHVFRTNLIVRAELLSRVECDSHLREIVVVHLNHPTLQHSHILDRLQRPEDSLPPACLARLDLRFCRFQKGVRGLVAATAGHVTLRDGHRYSAVEVAAGFLEGVHGEAARVLPQPSERVYVEEGLCGRCQAEAVREIGIDYEEEEETEKKRGNAIMWRYDKRCNSWTIAHSQNDFTPPLHILRESTDP